MSIFFRRLRQGSIGVINLDSLATRKSNYCPVLLETFFLFHRASIPHCRMIVLRIRKHPRMVAEEVIKMDRILKLRLLRNLTGQQTESIREARNFWSSWKIDGSLVLLQNR